MHVTEKSPAFQWYPKDDLASIRVTLMTLEEEGAYRRAMNYCWLAGALPADTKKLAQLIGKGCSLAVAETVKGMFVEKNGVLIHERLDQEREKQKDFRERQSANGKKGGRPMKEETQTKAKQNPDESQTKAKKSSPVSPLHSPSSSASPSSTSTSISSTTPSSLSITSAEENTNNTSADARGDLKNNELNEEKPATKEKTNEVPLPWPGGEFAAEWQKWKDWKREQYRFTFNSDNIELAQLKHLQTLSGDNEKQAIAILHQSIGNGWKGLFKVTSDGNKGVYGKDKSVMPYWRR